MVDSLDNPEYRKFVQSVIDNIKKNGFPEKRVAFGLEKMYEIAYNKGINFNKVLETLREIKIDHEKTPERIIFFPRQPTAEQPRTPASPFAGLDPSLFSNLDPSMFANLDPSMFANMNLGNLNMAEMIQAAAQMMQNMTPEQLESIKQMYDNMSDEDRAALIEKFTKKP